jgi:hypothetical protein
MMLFERAFSNAESRDAPQRAGSPHRRAEAKSSEKAECGLRAARLFRRQALNQLHRELMDLNPSAAWS